MHPVGLEPTTYWSEASRSIQLSYGCLFYIQINFKQGLGPTPLFAKGGAIQLPVRLWRKATGAILKIQMSKSKCQKIFFANRCSRLTADYNEANVENSNVKAQMSKQIQILKSKTIIFIFGF